MTTAKFAFVSAERGSHAVATLCRVIGASVSGFYAWLRAIPALQGRAEAEAPWSHGNPAPRPTAARPDPISDRGVQYASEPYRAVLERYGIVQSMSRRGNCLRL